MTEVSCETLKHKSHAFRTIVNYHVLCGQRSTCVINIKQCEYLFNFSVIFAQQTTFDHQRINKVLNDMCQENLLLNSNKVTAERACHLFLYPTLVESKDTEEIHWKDSNSTLRYDREGIQRRPHPHFRCLTGFRRYFHFRHFPLSTEAGITFPNASFPRKLEAQMVKMVWSYLSLHKSTPQVIGFCAIIDLKQTNRQCSGVDQGSSEICQVLRKNSLIISTRRATRFHQALIWLSDYFLKLELTCQHHHDWICSHTNLVSYIIFESAPR